MPNPDSSIVRSLNLRKALWTSQHSSLSRLEIGTSQSDVRSWILICPFFRCISKYLSPRSLFVSYLILLVYNRQTIFTGHPDASCFLYIYICSAITSPFWVLFIQNMIEFCYSLRLLLIGTVCKTWSDIEEPKLGNLAIWSHLI